MCSLTNLVAATQETRSGAELKDAGPRAGLRGIPDPLPATHPHPDHVEPPLARNALALPVSSAGCIGPRHRGPRFGPTSRAFAVNSQCRPVISPTTRTSGAPDHCLRTFARETSPFGRSCCKNPCSVRSHCIYFPYREAINLWQGRTQYGGSLFRERTCAVSPCPYGAW
jgi:hypothetical protein